MITLYRVRDAEDVYAAYLVAQRAENHKNEINRRFPDEALAYVETREIDELHGQTVVIDGDVVSYQFSQTKHGQRALSKAVMQLAYDANGIATGVVYWQGTPYPVFYNSLKNRWYMAESQKYVPGQLYARHDRLMAEEVTA